MTFDLSFTVTLILVAKWQLQSKPISRGIQLTPISRGVRDQRYVLSIEGKIVITCQ